MHSCPSESGPSRFRTHLRRRTSPATPRTQLAQRLHGPRSALVSPQGWRPAGLKAPRMRAMPSSRAVPDPLKRIVGADLVGNPPSTPSPRPDHTGLHLAELRQHPQRPGPVAGSTAGARDGERQSPGTPRLWCAAAAPAVEPPGPPRRSLALTAPALVCMAARAWSSRARGTGHAHRRAPAAWSTPWVISVIAVPGCGWGPRTPAGVWRRRGRRGRRRYGSSDRDAVQFVCVQGTTAHMQTSAGHWLAATTWLATWRTVSAARAHPSASKTRAELAAAIG